MKFTIPKSRVESLWDDNDVAAVLPLLSRALLDKKRKLPLTKEEKLGLQKLESWAFDKYLKQLDI